MYEIHEVRLRSTNLGSIFTVNIFLKLYVKKRIVLDSSAVSRKPKKRFVRLEDKPRYT